MPFVLTSPSGAAGSIVALNTPHGPFDSTIELVSATGPQGATGPAGAQGAQGASGGGSVAAGSLHENFIGGVGAAITATSTVAEIGECGWNYQLVGVSTGNSTNKIAGVAGAVGIQRITSPTVLNSTGTIYLGSPTLGAVLPTAWAECTWRARFDTNALALAFQNLGMGSNASNNLGAGDSAGFNVQLAGVGSNANYRTQTSQTSAGNALQSTGVAVDNLFHNFRIVRVSATQIDFFIDGVLRTSHTAGGGAGMPALPLMPFAQAGGGSVATSVLLDLDDFQFVPT